MGSGIGLTSLINGAGSIAVRTTGKRAEDIAKIQAGRTASVGFFQKRAHDSVLQELLPSGVLAVAGFVIGRSADEA
jgi:hypothetical protein